jgi:hypothetical protein
MNDEAGNTLLRRMPRVPGILLVLMASAGTVAACEPAVQLLIVFAGPSYLSIVSLGLVVFLKCGIFAYLERDLKRGEAFRCLFAGNVYSTLIGLLIGILLAAPMLALALFPVVFLLSLAPARRIIEFSGWGWARKWRPYQIAAVMTLLALGSLVFYVAAHGAFESKNYALYWPLKIGYIVCGLSIGIGLTSLWEERVVGGLAARKHPPRGYFTSVIRANYITFGIALLIGAIRILPERLKSPHFLARLLETIGLS